jgi:hypothetical protein
MKRKILKGIALAIDVGAPAIATISQFPIWINKSAEATVSGICVLFVLLSSVPLIRWFKRLMKSPSAPIMWGLLLGLFLALEAIIDEMIIISFVGVTANLIGAVLFKIADKNCIKEE